MSRSTSPDALTREPKPQTGQPPAALRRRGILSASESIEQGGELAVGGALWLFYKHDLYKRFWQQPKEA